MAISSQYPKVKELLLTFRNQNVFFEPLGGNHGDRLIELGSIETIQSIPLKIVNDASKADLIIINGGGGMTPLWKHGLQVLENYLKTFPHTPLIVLPSSWDLTGTNLTTLLRKHKAPVFLYARELYSFALLEKISVKNNLQIGLDHDMAFNIRETLYFRKLSERKAEKHLLIVEREDIESTTGLRYRGSFLIQLIKSFTPKVVRCSLPRSFYFALRNVAYSIDRCMFGRKRKSKAAMSEFVGQTTQFIQREHPEFGNLPIYAGDISLPTFCSFKQFGFLIAQAAVVVTTRLHVGILSALLDKPTYFKVGNWHKIRGVYEYSLNNNKNVGLI